MRQAGIRVRTGLKRSAGGNIIEVPSLVLVVLLIFAVGFSNEKDTKAISDALNLSMDKDSIKLVFAIGRVNGTFCQFYKAGTHS